MKDMLLEVEPLIPALRRYARALVRNRADADDLVQDCLERAVSRWYQRRDGGVRAWLFTILHNLAINQFRRSATRGRHVTIDETNEDDHSYRSRLFWPSDFRDEVLSRLLALNAERHADEVRLGTAPEMKGKARDDDEAEEEVEA